MTTRNVIWAALAFGLSATAPLTAQEEGQSFSFFDASESDEDRTARYLFAAKDIKGVLFDAVSDHASARVCALLLRAGADPNATNENGQSVLMYAVFGSDAEVVRVLLDAGADVNHVSKDGETALMMAASGSVEMVELLISVGAEVNERTNEGETALMVAAMNG
ncbi:MAG: ankyrin repeat domain-containing protein, partial [Akkermansia sp.]